MNFPTRHIVSAAAGALTLAGPVAAETLTFPGFAPPAQPPPAWVGQSGGGAVRRLTPTRPTLGLADRRFTSGVTTTPLCVSQSGWLGGAYVYRRAGAADQVLCITHADAPYATTPALLLEPTPSNTTWLRWSSNQLEPRGAASVFRQPNGRVLRACAVEAGTGQLTKTVFGYVGDDGRCYGVFLADLQPSGSQVRVVGTPTGYDDYQLLMSGGTTGTALLPQDGWLSVHSAILPRGVLESYGGGPVCRGRQGTDMWPGYVNAQTKQCDLFTYYGDKTARVSVADYEVHRWTHCFDTGSNPFVGTLGTADKLCTYQDNKGQLRTTNLYRRMRQGVKETPNNPMTRVGGKAYWLCRGVKAAVNISYTDEVLLGFTNKPGTIANGFRDGCTDGVTTWTGKSQGTRPTVNLHSAPTDDRG